MLLDKLLPDVVCCTIIKAIELAFWPGNSWKKTLTGGYCEFAAEWLPVKGIGRAIGEDLGYEDIDEFEDALNGSFEDFLDNFPHVEKKTREDGLVGCHLQICPIHMLP